MPKQHRKKRTIVNYQVNDLGANPQTKRGRKWIKKEIRKIDEVKLRRSLESQKFDDSLDDKDYWGWMELHGFRNSEGDVTESPQANPDVLSDEDLPDA